jgi:predicted secreted hydrolase
VEWDLQIPSADAALHLIPLLDNQELVTLRSTGIAYWEGAIEIRGTWRGRPVHGRGYVELTGYDEKYKPRV